jgi:aryl-alcohol dehydrogenase-like predicted oxidoreductase
MRGGVVDGKLASSFPAFQGENLRKNLETVGLAELKDQTPAQIAIAWVLSRGDDIVPLIGMSRRSRLPENLRALDAVFSADELAALDQAFALGAIVGSRS